MAQFDVYINPSRSSKGAYPYLVDVQHDLIADIATRMVIPLGKFSHFKNEQMQGLTPDVEYEGEKLLLLTPQIASIPAKLLKDPVGSLSHFRYDIIASLDFAITGI
ncbi:MAG: CcdB family protein [Pseudomonadales bacterium]|nr:CcdB family protein [Pseudomonadales bacterium]